MGSWSRTLGGSCLIFLISSCRVLLLQVLVYICCSTSSSDCSQSPRSMALSYQNISRFMPTQNSGKSAIALVAKRNHCRPQTHYMCLLKKPWARVLYTSICRDVSSLSEPLRRTRSFLVRELRSSQPYLWCVILRRHLGVNFLFVLISPISIYQS